MKYRLKSRSLQLRLDEISGGDFTKQFNDIARIGKDPFVRSRTVYFELAHDSRILISIEVTPDMVDEIQEYNPKKWNVWPDVTPPEGVFMRAETESGEKMCAVWISNDKMPKAWNKWRNESGGAWATVLTGVDEIIDYQFEDGFFIRFRPWDD